MRGLLSHVEKFGAQVSTHVEQIGAQVSTHVEQIGAIVSTQLERPKLIENETKTLRELEESSGCNFPGSDHHPTDRKNWISGLNPDKVHLNQIVWPGTHDSATNQIGVEIITRPFAECQSLSIYEQLVLGTRLLDVRVNENREVCHGILVTYGVDVVINDVKRFISETESEIIILEIRTEFGHTDPPEFENYLEQQLGEYLIHQDDKVFDKTVAEILPKRIICIWKPRNSNPPKPGGPFWSSGYLQDNWIDTDLPATKFESNLNYLSKQPSVNSRKYFYRVENTLTPQTDNIVVHVKPVTNRIRWCARLFIAQCFAKNIADRLQVYSTDFIDEDFVDACVGLTWARIEGKA
ncbi:putative phosphoinositide phospholipase C, Phosphatidylinositol diacylglycerol-lyase [Helianthus anomalus]